MAIVTGLTGLFIIFRSELNLRSGITEIPPFFSLYFPGSFLLILAGITVMIKSLMPRKCERYCARQLLNNSEQIEDSKTAKKSEIPTYAKNAGRNIFTRVK